MLRDHRIQLFIVFVVFTTALTAVAQKQADSSKEAVSKEKKDDKGEKTAAEAYAAAYKQWTTLQSDIDKAIDSLKIAFGDDKEAAKDEYAKLVTQANGFLPKLRAAAMDAYRDAPNEDRQIVRVLLGIANNHLRRDQFEQAFETAKLLIDNECKENVVFALAGRAAYCLDDYETAESYLKKAKAEVLDLPASKCLEDVEAAKENWAKEQAIRSTEAGKDDLPRVKLETSKGDILVELFENEAPNTVANFISLVEKKFYDGLEFHRVLPGFMAQGGRPTDTEIGGPGYKIPCECYGENHRKHFRGSLSMAHAGRDSGGSQFFITFCRTPHLDGMLMEEWEKLPPAKKNARHTVFGRVIEGFDVLPKLQRINPAKAKSPTPDRIIKATVERKREHEYKPTKVGDSKTDSKKVDEKKEANEKKKDD